MYRIKNIRRILIANRGEIASRIIRTCREMNIETVAVYSDPDAGLRYVQEADESRPLHGVFSQDTYLDGDKIISLAMECGAEAIHPGYGFLSENADFARKVEEKGLIFIGPSANSIESMGNKIAAKKLAIDAGVPLIPGKAAPVLTVDQAIKEADAIGYPVLLKAAAGGGGKGMRTIHDEEEMRTLYERVKSEAKSAFGDDTVFVEKYIMNPKHVEIQVFGDQQGNYVHLFERDCSVQRRHQKVIEEAPCAIIREETREKMGAAAVNLAQAVDYYSSGTVEFLMDHDQKFFFLEMNTRLQVEHPVTEMITGVDLVAWQILVADGQSLPLAQKDLTIQGHAIELRLYAEQYLENFAPSPGVISRMHLPDHPGIRLDMGFETGDEVTLYYDPMIGKVICWGEDRDQCLKTFISWLRTALIMGVDTTLPFGLVAFRNPEFRSGDYSISFYEKMDSSILEKEEKILGEVAAHFAKYFWEKEKKNKYLLR